MNKVYRHRPRARDEYLGRVDESGRVYEARLGPDKYTGRVDLESGKIYDARPGVDKQIGRVDKDGKVYLSKLGPDSYFGKVTNDGKLYLHRTMASDKYLGRVSKMISQAHGGGAFLLLVQPAYEEEISRALEEVEDPELGDTEAGSAPAPA